MAFVISTDGGVADAARRHRIYSGEVFCLPPRDSIRAFADFAWELIIAAFGDHDPATAHDEIPVEEYVRILGPLKTGFTHHLHSKELLRDVLIDLGADPTRTYFDVPKLRAVPPASYLTAGLGYNYTPHRDTWYSSPQCQNNWWAPIVGVTSESCMAFHPDYWQQPADNTSADFDAYEWNRTSRRDAATYITSDPRPHPRLSGHGPGSEIRIVGEVGSILSFSGAQLHSTVPNTTGRARFSLDFRTVDLDDLITKAGPVNIDSVSTGTSVRDYRRADSYDQLPDEVIDLYDQGGSADGVLVFDPAVLKAP
ncbi:hypothetical protein Rhow_001774 [Rhodococcus wratislaviensis]|uniref:Phytanoyl-CoA dioxygenase family protein n=1 Tax=Rhodococcus wratislaviensis TaxID=44752 RepID=A0A402BYE7_RHOWR|nr:hypothetical protein [Rhodococcus wratislaviensis]GCE36408.1 hypothetical protein Rhow_001774 [Rhodococcus wratislaviensis]